MNENKLVAPDFKSQEEYLKWVNEQLEKCNGRVYPEDEEIFQY